MNDLESKYPANSNKSIAEQMDKPKKEIVPVAQGSIHKDTLGDKMAKTLFSENTNTVKNYLRDEVFIPAIKNFINDSIINGVQMLLFGSARGGGGRSYYNPNSGSRTNYSSYYVSNSSSGSRSAERVRNGDYSYPLVEVSSRGEADDIIARMGDLIREYGSASVSDLLAFTNLTPRFSDERWGWTDARDLSWSRKGMNYIMDFAPPVRLD